MDQTQRAWAAGFFDGEGCFSPHKRTRNGRTTYGLRIAITQLDREVLDKFCSIVGVGTVRGPYLPPSKARIKANPYYIYSASGKQVRQVARVLWPFLGTQKRAQYRRMIDRVS